MLRIPLEIEYIREKQKDLYIENTDLIEALEDYETKEVDLLAGDFSFYYLEAIDSFVPYRIVNIIITVDNSRIFFVVWFNSEVIVLRNTA